MKQEIVVVPFRGVNVVDLIALWVLKTKRKNISSKHGTLQGCSM